MTRKDLAAALHHLDRLPVSPADPHRLELESLLLDALIRAERAEGRAPDRRRLHN